MTARFPDRVTPTAWLNAHVLMTGEVCSPRSQLPSLRILSIFSFGEEIMSSSSFRRFLPGAEQALQSQVLCICNYLVTHTARRSCVKLSSTLHLSSPRSSPARSSGTGIGFASDTPRWRLGWRRRAIRSDESAPSNYRGARNLQTVNSKLPIKS